MKKWLDIPMSELMEEKAEMDSLVTSIAYNVAITNLLLTKFRNGLQNPFKLR